MDPREECLLTVHARESEWMLGGGDYTYIIVSLVRANTYLLQCHVKKLQESENERARLDEKI